MTKLRSYSKRAVQFTKERAKKTCKIVAKRAVRNYAPELLVGVNDKASDLDQNEQRSSINSFKTDASMKFFV